MTHMQRRKMGSFWALPKKLLDHRSGTIPITKKTVCKQNLLFLTLLPVFFSFRDCFNERAHSHRFPPISSSFLSCPFPLFFLFFLSLFFVTGVHPIYSFFSFFIIFHRARRPREDVGKRAPSLSLSLSLFFLSLSLLSLLSFRPYLEMEIRHARHLLSGERKGKKWKCVINRLSFARVPLHLLP